MRGSSESIWLIGVVIINQPKAFLPVAQQAGLASYNIQVVACGKLHAWAFSSESPQVSDRRDGSSVTTHPILANRGFQFAIIGILPSTFLLSSSLIGRVRESIRRVFDP